MFFLFLSPKFDILTSSTTFNLGFLPLLSTTKSISLLNLTSIHFFWIALFYLLITLY